MMSTTQHYARASATAIAAALALSSTPALSQQAQPTDPAAAPVTDTAPPATLDAAPLTTDTSVATPVATHSQTARTAAPRRVTQAAARARPTLAPAHVAARTTTSHAVAPKPVQAAAAAAPAAAAPAAAAPAAPPPVAEAAAPATPAPPASAASQSGGINQTELMFGGGALALIALAAAAIALRRRRARDEWIEQDEMESVADEPEAMGTSDPIFADQPAVVAPAASAFAWGNEDRAEASAAEDDGSDRRPGESWVERAYRGPSPSNPSESLKTRLGRAAFFDKRERDVAAGIAEPVDPTEGLPEAMVEQQDRELA